MSSLLQRPPEFDHSLIRCFAIRLEPLVGVVNAASDEMDTEAAVAGEHPQGHPAASAVPRDR